MRLSANDMQKKAFTLLETMVALGIVVLALGAGASISRSILVGGQVGEDAFHANQLADNAIAAVKGTQAYIFNGTLADKTLSNFFQLAVPPGPTATRVIIPYRSAANSGNNVYPVSWCFDAGSCSSSVKSSIGTLGVQRTLQDDFNGGGIETIAVNRNPDLASSEFRNTVDYLLPTTAVARIQSFAECTGVCTWDYYTRKITLRRLTTDFLGNAAATGSAFELKVEVSNLRTSVKVSKTVLLTDFGATGNTGANQGGNATTQQQQQAQN